MRAQVTAVSPEAFKTWADNKRDEIEQAGEALAEQRKQREGQGN